MSVLSTLAVLAVPLLLGVLAGAARLFADPDAAVGALNRYLLYLAFPALIVVGMLDRALALPTGLGIYLVVPGVAVLLTALLALLRRTRLRDEAGPVALTALFANTAYVGLPVVEGVLGPEMLGVGAVAVAVHVTTAMLLGPLLLLWWSPTSHKGALSAVVGRVARQPLAWAPLVGLGLRLVPGSAALVDLLGPVGRSASPVGLFLIGVFVHTHGRGLRIDARAWLRVGVKLLLVPALTLALVRAAIAAGQLQPRDAAVLLLLSAMPTAISSFAIAREFELAVEEVTVAIVLSTALSAALIPVVASLVG